MSASLVGSEMCIRDRHFNTFRYAFVNISRVGAGGLSPSIVKFGAMTRTICLLYTSDAADDM
eukprot:306957-Alexandrium_andersonii.AAC.1